MSGGGKQVTDHAVLRYMDRILNVPVEAIRDHLTVKGIDTAAAFGAECVVMEECRLVLAGSIVVTVLPKRLGKKHSKQRRAA